MAKKKRANSTSAKPKPVDIGQLYDNNLRLLAKSSEIALTTYVEIVKSLTAPGLAKTAADATRKVAEGWRDALIQSNKILRSAYENIGREIK
jgi:hypothetical protein